MLDNRNQIKIFCGISYCIERAFFFYFQFKEQVFGYFHGNSFVVLNRWIFYRIWVIEEDILIYVDVVRCLNVFYTVIIQLDNILKIMKIKNMKKLLVSLLLLHQFVFLNASEWIRDFDVHEPAKPADKVRQYMYHRNIPELIAILQYVISEDDKKGGIIKLFLQFHNTRNGYDLLHIAALGASVKLTELALTAGVIINGEQYWRCRCTPLHFVSGDSWSKKDNEKPSYKPADRLAVAKLLLDGGADVNRMNRDHQTPLMYAMRNENIDLVDLFLQHGARINFDNLDDYKQPLYRACSNNNVAIVKLLLESGANPFCVANKSYPVSRIRIDEQVKIRDKEIRNIVAQSARNLVPCYGDFKKWNCAIANLETWSNR